ncbi:MAG: FAD-dependent oxidoreductase [Planctomycetes bacterium]|nr:FAD-dependent oxidoreductase [Planctomycetota bacterium]
MSRTPGSARILIVGGGVIGASVAYHLGKDGVEDVVLVEQGELACGTTWHAAGMVGQLRTSNSLTRINKYSAELYAGLEAETGVSCGWRQCGSLILATSLARMQQLRRTCGMAELFGVDAQLIDAAACAERWPNLRTDDVLGGAWLPGDGRVEPRELTIALAEGACQAGVRVVEKVRVDDLVCDGRRVTGVTTSEGPIRAETVILCGGMWTRELAARCGVDVPLWPVEHHYVLTAPIDGVSDDLPVGRDPDRAIYFRPEGDRVMLGAFQKRSKAWDPNPIPPDFAFQLLDPDWDRYEEPLAAGRHRIPALEQAEITEFTNGPESFTPDNTFIMGEAPGLRGAWICAGFNSVGIASAGGAGRYLAEWITSGHAPFDLWSVDPTRFGPALNTKTFLIERSEEVLGLHYQMAWPNREMETGRDLRLSPLHDTLADAGACFVQKMGWERPAFFGAAGTRPGLEYAFGRQNWHDAVGAEMHACRNSVAVFDQTSFSKLRVEGPDAALVLQTLCANDVDVSPGRVVYTAMLNARGTFESDLTVVRLSENVFWLITATSQTWHDYWWVCRHLDDARAVIIDETGSRGVLGVMGPHARDLLARVTDADLSNDAFPFGAARSIGLGPVRARALRITYVGELGFELHVPVESMATAYRVLMDAGSDLGVANAGHYAINALRLEKAYRAWGADITSDETPFEAGLARFCAFDKPVPFLGRDALLMQKARGLSKRLLAFRLTDGQPMLWGQEPILRDGTRVGYTTSGAYGHTLGASVALGYVNGKAPLDRDWLKSGRYEIEIDGLRVAAEASLKPFYDPRMERVKS